MSLVTLAPDARPAFVQRFDAIRVRSRLLGLAAAAAVTATVFLIGLLALAVADYVWELPRAVRIAGLATASVAAVALFAFGTLRVGRRTTARRVAAAVERRFPQLGQSVRTLVQYAGGDVSGLGAAPSLAAALADDTARVAGPLPLESVVPVRRAILAGLAFAVAAGTVLVLAATNWEWETAFRRSLLDERPWTTLAAVPGATSVKEGEDLPLSLTVAGRTDRETTLYWRMQGEPDWSERPLEVAAASAAGPRTIRHETALARIDEPLEYRFAAGAFAAGPFLVEVRRPLSIVTVAVELTPPAYTALPVRTEETGDVTAVEGSHARFRIELDREPASAEMVFALPAGTKAEAAPVAMPFVIAGRTLTAELDLTEPFDWSVRAESKDGMPIRENGWRVRIRRDAAPQVWFESPAEQIEVHSLAELLMAIRVRDDFGLAQAGIVFQVNNEQEHTLLLEEFGDGPPRTRAELSRKLPLEFFELTQKDGVTYYAFVEDNRPENPHRVVTDLRFVDLRPFRRIFRYDETEAMPGMPGGPRIRSLEEIIRGERSILNRTLKAERRPAGEEFGVGSIDRIADAQAELAESARRLAEFFVAEEIDGADLMFQAEGVMLAAADSLTAGRFDTASLQERDALRFLIEARNSFEIFLKKNPKKADEISQKLRQLEQKLRREKDDGPREVAAELRKLSRDEERIAQATAMPGPPSANGDGGGKPDPNAEPTETKPAAGADETKPEEGTEPAEPAMGSGGSDEPMEPEVGGAMTPQEIEDLQGDVARRASDLEARMGEMKELTDLARSRMTAAVAAAEKASGELARGDTSSAGETAEDAAGKFAELAEQVAALLEEEPARRIAKARDLADELADEERELAGNLAPMKGEEGEKSPRSAGGMAQAKADAERLARGGETLADLLKSVTESENPAAGETADRLAQAIGEGRIEDAVEEMKRQPGLIGGGKTDEAEKSAAGLAERLDATARTLDRVYRSVVAPKVEQLARLEAEAAKLRDRLEEIRNTQQSAGWTREMADLLDEVQDVPGISAEDELREALGAGGWSLDQRGVLVAPLEIRNGSRRLVEDLQLRLQELLLAEVLSRGEDAVPAAYRDLVDRYYRVLSTSGGPRPAE